MEQKGEVEKTVDIFKVVHQTEKKSRETTEGPKGTATFTIMDE